jgi:GNAT superfamily N-acetyltransferase
LASADPEVIVAVEDGKMVGARHFMLAEMWLGNEKVMMAQGCDDMVHPEHRNRGIYHRMGEFATRYLKENGFALSYGIPGPMSLPDNLRQGYRVVAQIEDVFRAVNPARLLSYRLKNRVLAGGLGLLYSVLFPSGLRKSSPPPSPFEIRAFDRFTDELRELDSLRDQSAIELVRSEAYLRWRFDQHPDHTYRYVIVRRDGGLWGYAVVSVQKEANGLVYGIIVDYGVKDGDVACFRALMGKCLEELSRSECDLVLIWAFSQPLFRSDLLRHFGLKSSLRFPYSRFVGYDCFEAMLVDERLARRIDIYDKGNWRITHVLHDIR